MFTHNLFLLAAAVGSTYASPVQKADCTTTATPTLPTTGGATELPSASGLTLKHITIGHGIQNYTCASSTANTTSMGALAVLWDITHLYPGTSRNSLPEEAWNSLPSKVLWHTEVPLNLVGNSITPFAADTCEPFRPDYDLDVDGHVLKTLGHHYFDSSLTPTFDLYDTRGHEKFQGKKLGDVKAPAGADPGLYGTGAVDWLDLGDKGIGTTVGLSHVYRVETAGGNPLKCSKEGEAFSIPYTAMYWFYD